jgi:hypothetical protein
MNWKKFFIAFIAVWIFTFFYGFLLHAKIMHSSYAEVPAMWRPEADFKANFPILVLGQGIIAFFFSMIFVRGFGSGGGAAGGFRYGLLLGLLVCGANLIRYAVEPLTTTILFGWCVGEIIQFSIAGLVVGAIYKPLAASAT